MVLVVRFAEWAQLAVVLWEMFADPGTPFEVSLCLNKLTCELVQC